MDDMASGDTDEDAAFTLYKMSKQCLAEGSLSCVNGVQIVKVL